MAGFAALAVVAGAVGAVSEARELRERPRLFQRHQATTHDNAPAQEHAYGRDALQNLDFWPGRGTDAPLVVFVHGGGWKRGDKAMMAGSAKLAHWQGKGYAVASLNYRLVPAATVENQAQDVAAAVAWLRGQVGKLGVDPKRIVLVGHSAGAHLVALVGTDPQWLKAHRLSPSDVAGVIPLDGAAYDVADQIGENPRLMGATYSQAFGADPARHRALSPTIHAAAPNAPAFLILHVERADAARQGAALAEALRNAGTKVELHAVEGRGLRGHMEINRQLGDPDYPATALVDKWLAARFGG